MEGESKNGFSWKGHHTSFKEFVVDGEKEQMCQRQTKSINFDWERINYDEEELTRPDNYEPFSTEIFECPLLSKDDYYTQGRIDRKITIKKKPDKTDFNKQWEDMLDGWGIINNLNVAELDCLNQMKEDMQTKIY